MLADVVMQSENYSHQEDEHTASDTGEILAAVQTIFDGETAQDYT